MKDNICDFFKDVSWKKLGLVTAVTSTLLNPIPAMSQEIDVDYAQQINYKRFTTNEDYAMPLEETLPWKELGITTFNGKTTKLDYEMYEFFVDEVNKKIKRKESYTKEELLEILKTMHNVKENNFEPRYAEGTYLNECFQENESAMMDCKDRSKYYFGCGQALGLPFQMVRCTRDGYYHQIIGANCKSDKYIGWETTDGEEIFASRHHPLDPLGSNYKIFSPYPKIK